jgi:DNA-binding LacI/PurR family transcriptional regulator
MRAAGVDGIRLTATEDVAAARGAVEQGLDAGFDADAIVCVSDTLAVGALLALNATGRRLPVIGFDNTPTADALGFSSVEQRPEDVADGVLTLLMGSTGDVVVPRRPQAGTAHVLIEPELVIR